MSAADALDETRAWLEKAVIGLNLCPFAKAVHARSRIRWVLSPAHEPQALLEELVAEMKRLVAADPDGVETTLIVHPGVLGDFLDFNDFLDVADAALEDLALEGIVQIASFHPAYRFADTAEDDVGNCTNRAPHPTLQLLREDSVERALDAYPQAETIFERNIETMERLGADGWRALMRR